MKYIGKYGEYLVLCRLLEQNIEAYQAIIFNQPDYDLTAILEHGQIIRIQVKSTDLNSKGTNNVIAGVDKEYDVLIIVIFEEGRPCRFFILTKSEAMLAKGQSKQLGTTQQRKKKFYVKNNLLPYEDQWSKITNPLRAIHTA
jgi:hypothetical protein